MKALFLAGLAGLALLAAGCDTMPEEEPGYEIHHRTLSARRHGHPEAARLSPAVAARGRVDAA